MAQSIAFTALFALVPLSIVAVAMLAFIYGTDDGMARANERFKCTFRRWAIWSRTTSRRSCATAATAVQWA